MKTAEYGIHHQIVVDCPKCGEMIIEDLGEMDTAGPGDEMECPDCGCEFELGEKL